MNKMKYFLLLILFIPVCAFAAPIHLNQNAIEQAISHMGQEITDYKITYYLEYPEDDDPNDGRTKVRFGFILGGDEYIFDENIDFHNGYIAPSSDSIIINLNGYNIVNSNTPYLGNGSYTYDSDTIISRYYPGDENFYYRPEEHTEITINGPGEIHSYRDDSIWHVVAARSTYLTINNVLLYGVDVRVTNENNAALYMNNVICNGRVYLDRHNYYTDDLGTLDVNISDSYIYWFDIYDVDELGDLELMNATITNTTIGWSSSVYDTVLNLYDVTTNGYGMYIHNSKVDIDGYVETNDLDNYGIELRNSEFTISEVESNCIELYDNSNGAVDNVDVDSLYIGYGSAATVTNSQARDLQVDSAELTADDLIIDILSVNHGSCTMTDSTINSLFRETEYSYLSLNNCDILGQELTNDDYNGSLLFLGNNVVFDSSLIMKNSTINSYGYGLVVGQPSSSGESELIIGPYFGNDYEESPHSIEITNTKITGNGGLIIGDNYAESIVVENCEIETKDGVGLLTVNNPKFKMADVYIHKEESEDNYPLIVGSYSDDVTYPRHMLQYLKDGYIYYKDLHYDTNYNFWKAFHFDTIVSLGILSQEQLDQIILFSYGFTLDDFIGNTITNDEVWIIKGNTSYSLPDKMTYVIPDNNDVASNVKGTSNYQSSVEINDVALTPEQGISIRGVKDLIESIELNGTQLSDNDYSLVETDGITTLSFSNDYLKGLEVGSYTVTVNLVNGTASSTLNVVNDLQDEPVVDNEDQEQQGQQSDDKDSIVKGEIENPKTGLFNSLLLLIPIIILSVVYIIESKKTLFKSRY